jgi:hypothetical protein
VNELAVVLFMGAVALLAIARIIYVYGAPQEKP